MKGGSPLLIVRAVERPAHTILELRGGSLTYRTLPRDSEESLREHGVSEQVSDDARFRRRAMGITLHGGAMSAFLPGELA